EPTGTDGNRYFIEQEACRHGFAIVNHNMEFINFVTGWPGSTHDSRIFDSSRVCYQFEEREVTGILLGDSGYPCQLENHSGEEEEEPENVGVREEVRDAPNG
ncbi:hypothetical protein L9F63_027385, partial [Diploptera punctata]